MLRDSVAKVLLPNRAGAGLDDRSRTQPLHQPCRHYCVTQERCAAQLISDTEMTCTLSVIVPVFNEEQVLPALHRRMVTALFALQETWELIFIDDGSGDSTADILKGLQVFTPQIGVVRLSRNFGKEAAMSAGLRFARGKAVVIIDADLQDPPELIGEMVAAWCRGADVVNMRRRHRAGETWLKRATAHVFYRVINQLSEVAIPSDVGDFRLLSRRAVDALNQLPEHNRFMKGLFAWVGYRQITLDYDRHPRAAGHTKWHYWKLWNFALEGITSFSTVPLKLAAYAGLSSATAAFCYALYVLLKTLLIGEAVTGFPTLIVTILLLGGLQLMATGILGEYLGRLFVESKHRPLYLLDEYRPSAAALGEDSVCPSFVGDGGMWR